MTEYIEREALAQQVCVKLCTASNCSNVLKIIHDMPTADVVEVVRCKDCFKKESCRAFSVWAVPPSDDWFCADGERRRNVQESD